MPLPPCVDRGVVSRVHLTPETSVCPARGTVKTTALGRSPALLELSHLAGDKTLPPEWLEHLQFIPKPYRAR